MKTLKWLGIGLVAFVVLGTIAIGLMPPEYTVSRTITVPDDCAFEHVNDVTRHDAWSPFKAMEPTLDITYGPITAGAGASYDWNGEMGTGRLTILQSSPPGGLAPGRVESVVWSQDMGDTDELWSFEHGRATWRYTGEVPGFTGGLIASMMDPMLGGIFEDGLGRLQDVCTD